MSTYSLVIVGPPVVEEGKTQDFAPGAEPSLSHKNPPMKWVPLVMSADPTPGPVAATEKWSPYNRNVTLDAVTLSRTVVAKSVDEKDDFDSRAFITAARPQLRAIMQKLKDDPTTGTTAELKQALFFVLRVMRNELKDQ